MKEEKDFHQLEKTIALLQEKIEELLSSETGEERKKIPQLREKIEKEWKKISPLLTPLHIVQIARHPKRPYTLDYLGYLTQDFMEMHGDRRAGDDPAIIAGLGFYRGRTVAFIGHQKGRTTSRGWSEISASQIQRATGRHSG